MPPNARMLGGLLLKAMNNPQMQDLIEDYQEVKDQLHITDSQAVSVTALNFLNALSALLCDRQAALAIAGESVDDLADALDCVATVENMVTEGGALADVAAVLWLFCERMDVDDHPQPVALLSRLDDFLVLLGFGDTVSVAALWQTSLVSSTALCDDMWSTLLSLLTSIRGSCRRRHTG